MTLSLFEKVLSHSWVSAATETPVMNQSETRTAESVRKPRVIAVLPFNNMSGNQNQEYIGDGFSENIITSLSKVGRMLVIARNSSFIYKNKPVKVQQVAKELGVQYVLEGSFQISKNRIRINAQLIDALNGYHLWSERYDRKFEDLFDLQDEITKKIVLSLHIELTRGEAAFLEARSTNNIEAWINVVKGYDLIMKMNKEDNYILSGRYIYIL
jgi:TolB-like protein